MSLPLSAVHFMPMNPVPDFRGAVFIACMAVRPALHGAVKAERLATGYVSFTKKEAAVLARARR